MQKAREKENIYPTKYRISESSKEREEGLLQ